MTPGARDRLSDPAQALVNVARRCAARAWVPATSGNFSVRLPSGQILITVSGADKGTLDVDHLMALELDGSPGSPAEARIASAETGLHLARYAADPGVGAVLHLHSTNAVLLSRRSGDVVTIEGFELQKALEGVGTHEATVQIPVLDNHQDMAALAPRAERAVAACAPTWGYLLRGHGLYTWGPDLFVAERHAEALDVLFHYLLQEAR